MKMKLRLVLLSCLFFIRLKLSIQCISYTEDIMCLCATCACSNFSVSCSGIQKNVGEVQDIFSNITFVYSESVESLDFNIEGLQFEPDFKFKNVDIKKLNVGHGLQTLNDDLLPGLSSSLISLNLKNNNIQQIENQPFSSLFNLKELMLDYNMLFELRPDTFLNLTNLEFLSISGNKLIELAQDVLKYLPVIQILILDHNNFSHLSKINVKSLSLSKLQVQNCSIEGALEKDSLSEIFHLIDVDFSYNKLTEVKPFALSALRSLKFLNLSYNVIEEIQDNAFTDLYNLTTLDLKHNSISVIKGTAFTDLKNLQVLDLSENELTVLLSDYTSNMLSLEKIYLHNNKIKTVTAGTFYYSPNLNELNLEGNTLECSCELLSVVGTITTNTSVKPENIHSLHCYRRNDYILVTDYEPEESCDIREEDFDYDDEDNSTHNASEAVGFEVTKGDSPSTVNSHSSTSLSPETSTKPNVILSTGSSTQLNESSEADEYYDYDDFTTFPSTDGMEFTISLNDNIKNTSLYTSNNNTEESDSRSTTEISSIAAVTTSTTHSFTKTTGNSLKIFATSSQAVKTTAVPISICDSLDFSPEISTSDSEMKIFEQFVRDSEAFCLKWSISGTIPNKPKCVIKYLYPGGTKSEHLQCPQVVNEIKTWSSFQNIFRFCIDIHYDTGKKKSCHELVTKTTTSPTFSTFVPTTIFSSSQIATETVSSTESTSTVFLPTSTELASTADNSAVAFNITAFDVYFTNYFQLKWQVSKIEPSSICTLTLVVITQNFEHRTMFNCTNNAYTIYNFEEQEIRKICLVSRHESYQNVSLCKNYSVPPPDAKLAKGRDKSYETFALIPLICLLIFALLIIIVVVFKNLYKKRIESDKYEVRMEEEKVQRRMTSSSHGRSSVRYSYTAKEQLDI